MTTHFDVRERLAYLQQEHSGLRLYCLLDGAQYLARTGKQYASNAGAVALFEGTPDAALAFAGPWLIDAASAASELIEEIVAFERASEGVSWLIAYQDREGLAQLLRLYIEAELPDGRRALVRLWDARVLANLAQVLDPDQRRGLFGHIFEWHLLLDRQDRVCVRRGDA